VVMVEGGGHSEVTAAPAVRRILEAYYGVKTGPTAVEQAAGSYAGSAPSD